MSWHDIYEIAITWQEDRTKFIKTAYISIPKEMTIDWMDKRGYLVQNGITTTEFKAIIVNTKNIHDFIGKYFSTNILELFDLNYNIRVIKKIDTKRHIQNFIDSYNTSWED